MMDNRKKEERKLLKRILLTILIFTITLTPLVILLAVYTSDCRQQNIVLFNMPELISAISASGFILIVFFAAYYLMAFLMTLFNLRLPTYPFIITGCIQSGFNKNLLDPAKNNWTTFYRADDEKLIIKRKNQPLTFLLGAILIGLGLIFFSFDVLQDKVKMETAGSLLLILLGLLNWLYNLICRTKYIEFNRMEGTITVTGFMLPFRTRTIPFEKVKVIAFKGNLTLTIPYRILNVWLIGEPEQEWWSFYVWYMDRNRPLPKGTLFESYQKKDYERRRAAGFPAGLYPVWGSFSEQMKNLELKFSE